MCHVTSRLISKYDTFRSSYEPARRRLSSIEYHVRTFMTSGRNQRRKVFGDSFWLAGCNVDDQRPAAWLRYGRRKSYLVDSVHTGWDPPSLVSKCVSGPTVARVWSWASARDHHRHEYCMDVYLHSPIHLHDTYAAFNLQFSFLCKLNKFV